MIDPVNGLIVVAPFSGCKTPVVETVLFSIVPSTSVSFATTVTDTDSFTFVVSASSTATGGDNTVMVTVVVSHKFVASQTMYSNTSVPVNPASGV